MAVVFSNNGKTTLSANVSSSATSISVSDGSVFPSLGSGEIFFCTLDDGTNNEIVKVTAISSNTLTVVRAQESTTARAFSTGDAAELRLTAGILGLFSQTGVVITDEVEAYLDGGNSTPTFASIVSNGTITSANIDVTGASGGNGQITVARTSGSTVAIQSQSARGLIGTSTNHAFRLMSNGTQRIELDTNGNFNLLSGALEIGGTTVIDSSRNLTNIGTISSGAITSSGTVAAQILSASSEIFLGASSLGKISQSGNNWIFNTWANSQYNERLRITDDGITVTGSVNVSTITSTGSMTLDVGANLTIDVDGTTITLADDGLNFGQFYNNASGQFNIVAPTQDKDIVFLGNDGGSTITALTLDMSVGGQLKAAPLGVSTPTYAFSNDSNTGMTRPTGDTLQLVTGGVERVRVDSAGKTTFSNHVIGPNAFFQNVYITSSGENQTNRIDNDGSSLYITHGGSNRAFEIGNTNGDVRLKYATNTKLATTSTGVEITGNLDSPQISINDYISHNGDSNTFLGFYAADTFELVTAGTQKITADANAAHLRYQGSAKLSTTSTGIDVTGTVTATTFSGALSGTIASATTATTQSAGDNSTKVATTAYTDTAIANLADSAPSTLNTLNELAAALGDDANFSTTVTNSIATKLPLAGGTMTGALNMGSQNITNAGTISSGLITTSAGMVVTDTSSNGRGIYRDNRGYDLRLGGGTDRTLGAYISLSGDQRGGANSASNGRVEFHTGGASAANASSVLGDFHWYASYNNGSTHLLSLDSVTGDLDLKLGGLKINGTTVIDASRALVSINTITSGGLVRINASGSVSSSIKLLVGTTNSSSSSAIAQFGGFLRARDYIFLHDSSTLTNAVKLAYNGGHIDLTGGEGSNTVPATRVNSIASPDGTQLLFPNNNGKIMIGSTSAPSYKLDISGTDAGFRVNKTANDAEIITKSTTAGAWFIAESPNYYAGILHKINGVEQWAVGNLNGQSRYAIRRGRSGTEVFTIKTDGKIGINNENPSALLHIQSEDSTTNDAVNMMILTALSTGTTTTGFGPAILLQGERNNGVNQNVGRIRSIAEVNSGSNISSGLAFETSTAGVLNERLRISYDGKVLIGTTNTTPAFGTGNGHAFHVGDMSHISRSGGTGLAINRASSDGDIVSFRKDGTQIGSIGTYASDLHIGTGNTGIGFNDNGRSIVPMNTSTPAYASSLISLGTSSVKFKDLHLSGTANVNLLKVSSYETELNSGHLRFKFNGGAYIDQNTVGQSLNFRVSGSSSLDTTALTLNSSGNANFSGTISSGAISSSSNITAGNSSNNGYIQANLASSGGTMTLYGYGLEMNRSASYIRPSSDNDKTLYIGAADASLDWNAIYFRSGAGLYMTGTRFIDNGRNLENIGSIKIGTTTVIDSSRNLQNIGTISSGDIDVSATNTNGLSIIDSSNSSASPLIKVQGNRQDANESQSFTGGLALSALQTNALANDGKHIGTIYFGTNHTNGTAGNIAYSASISARLSGAANSSTDMPTDLVFYTGSSGHSLGTANTTFGTERLRITSAGRLGLGTDSPTVKLEIQENTNSTDVKLRLRSFNSSSAGRSTYIAYNPDTRIMGFGEGGDEVNINQNGHLLVGTTNSSNTVAGFRAYSGGNIGVAINGQCAELNRLSSNGSILGFQKDGTTVGTIGVDSTDNLYIAGGSGSTKGLYFNDAGVIPATTGGGVVDNAVDLGQSGYRFKNLYLSGSTSTGDLKIGTTTVINGSRALTNIASANVAGNITIDYTGNGTNDAGLFVQNDASDWGIRIHKLSTHTYGMQIDADGSHVFRTVNSSGVEKFRINGDGDIETVRNITSTGYINSSNVQINSNGIYLLNGDYRVGSTAIVDSSRNLVNIGTISSGAITTSGFFHINASHTVYAGMVATTSTSNNSYNVIRFQQGSGSGAPTGLIGTAGSAVGNTAFRSGMNIGTQDSGSLNFIINDGYAGKFDTSKNLLVGRTSASGVDTDGHVLFSTGASYQSSNSSNASSVLYLNKNGDNGDLIQLYKSGTHKANIGLNGHVYLSHQDGKGLGIDGTRVFPTNADGTAITGSMDLGLSSFKFRDLYLSGTANVGETLSMSHTGNTSTISLTQKAGTQNSVATISANREDTSSSASRLLFSTNNGTSTLQRMRINNGGDISFYEDTGTSIGFFWDASAESLGIGTTSIIGKLHANDSAGATLTLTRTSGATSGNLGKIRFGNTDIDSDLASIVAIQDGATNNSALTFGTQTAGYAVAEAMRLDSSQNATFAGTISSGAITATGINSTSGTVQFTDGGATFDSSDSSGYPHFTQTNGSAQIGFSRTGGSAGTGYIGADASFLLNVYTSNFAKKASVSTNGTINAVSGYEVNGTTVIDSSRNLTNIASATFTNDIAINNGSPEMYFGTIGNHYNWRIAAQENVNAAFEISVGSQDTNYANDTYTTKFHINNTGTGTFAGDVVAYSDERLKSNIQTLDGKKALQMRGVSFEKDGKHSSGVIAQEIEKIAPELVHTNDDEIKTKSVAYGNLVGYLIEAIKEQQKEIEYMKSEINNLKEVNNGD